MKITRLMRKLFSDDIDIDFINKLNGVKLKGTIGDSKFKYTRLPDQTIKVDDRDNGESTIVKKSGESMIMKSGDDIETLPFSIRVFSKLSSDQNYNISELVNLFSDSGTDYTKLFNNFGSNFSRPLSPEEVKSARKKLKDIQGKIELQEDEINSKKGKVNPGTENENDHQKIVDERAELRLKKLKAQESGLKATISRNKEQVNKSISDIAKIDMKVNDLDVQDAFIKQKIEKDKSGFNKNGSGFNQYKGTTGNKALEKGHRTFSSIIYNDRFYSHSGYENEHTLIIGKLSELKLAPNEHSKSRLLGDLSLLIDKINDESISKITKSMLSELKKLKLTDDQYTSIIDDLIESLNTDSITRMFAMNENTESGHDIDNKEYVDNVKSANLGQDIHLDRMLLKGAAMGLGAWGLTTGFGGYLSPLGKAIGVLGRNVGNVAAHPIDTVTKMIPGTTAHRNQQLADIFNNQRLKNEKGEYRNPGAESIGSPFWYNMKALIPFSQARKHYKAQEDMQNNQVLMNAAKNSGTRVTPGMTKITRSDHR